jgi:hypothetical protein
LLIIAALVKNKSRFRKVLFWSFLDLLEVTEVIVRTFLTEAGGGLLDHRVNCWKWMAIRMRFDLRSYRIKPSEESKIQDESFTLLGIEQQSPQGLLLVEPRPASQPKDYFSRNPDPPNDLLEQLQVVPPNYPSDGLQFFFLNLNLPFLLVPAVIGAVLPDEVGLLLANPGESHHHFDHVQLLESNPHTFYLDRAHGFQNQPRFFVFETLHNGCHLREPESNLIDSSYLSLPRQSFDPPKSFLSRLMISCAHFGKVVSLSECSLAVKIELLDGEPNMLFEELAQKKDSLTLFPHFFRCRPYDENIAASSQFQF